MPIADRYVHALVLRRATDGPPDRTGHVQPVYLPENYAAFHGNWQDRTGFQVQGPELGGQVIADVVVFAARSLQPTERDQITREDRLAEILFVKDLQFGSINDHLEIQCREISSGTTGPGS